MYADDNELWDNETYNQILENIKDFLQLYFFKEANVTVEYTITHLFNLSDDDLATLKAVHFLLSDEVNEFIQIVPKLIKNLSHSTTKEEIETRGYVRGHINWSQTIKHRLKESFTDNSRFICNTNEKIYDLPENQLFKFILHFILKLSKQLTFINFEDDYKHDELENWYNDINKVYSNTRRYSKNVKFKNITLPTRITTKMLQKTKNNHNPLYNNLLKVYDLYDRIQNDEKELLKLINEQILKPYNQNKVYELHTLFKIIEQLDEECTNLGLLYPGNNYITHYKDQSKELKIYYQKLPEELENNNLMKYRNLYSLQLTNKRPDIIIEYISDNQSFYRLIEVKQTQNSDYIRDSIYKVFGYMKDYENNNLIYPTLLVVWDGIEIEETDAYNQELLILNHEDYDNYIEKIIF